MPSHRIANIPLSSSSVVRSSHHRLTNNNVSAPSAKRLLSYSRSSQHFYTNYSTKSATDAQIIRITCGQLFQALHGTSESLNGETLHHLCAEILVFSEAAIKTKCNDADQSTSPTRMARQQQMVANESFHEDQSLAGSIERRMAKVVEKVMIPKKPRHNPLATLFPPKAALDLFAKLPNDEGQYDMFLNICDPDLMMDEQEIQRDYLAFKRSDSNVPFMILFYVCGAFFMGTGYVWTNDVHIYRQYPTAMLSILFGLLASACLFLITLNRVIFLSFQYNIVCLQRFHEFVVNLYLSSYGQWLDNGTILFASLSTGFYLINIALIDLCDPEMDVKVGLNHGVACVSLVEPPPESFLLTMIIIIVLQLVARGVSRMTIVCSWIICIVAVNASISLSHSGNYVWMNLLLLFCVCISYELERQPLRQYLKTRKAIVDGEVAAELRQQLATYETLQTSQALDAKRSMVRHVSHEIRTPLNVVGVGVEMLIKDLESHASLLPDGVMETVHGIQDASNESLEVINELLEFEKLAAGLMTLDCHPTAILPFLEQAMKQHRLPARNKNISFGLEPSSMISPTMTINVDPMKVATVFRNLFSNAIKFTKKDGRVTVRVEIKHPVLGNELVVISVQDTGAGLSAANLDKLFGEGVHFNANELQGGGGSGLGLFNSKGIVDLHENGKIWAESEGEGKGCTFFVKFRLHSRHLVSLARGSVLDINRSSVRNLLSEECDVKQPKSIVPKASPIIEESQSPESMASESWKPTILVVDDSAMNRKMLVRMLISKGFACHEAQDGLEALSVMISESRFASAIQSKKQSSAFLNQLIESSVKNGKEPRNWKYNNSLALSFDINNQQQQFSVDAVLIDFHMPRMNGPDTIVEMRKLGFCNPIIGVSGGDKKTMTQFLEAGASDVIQKPAQSDQLVELLLTGFRHIIQEGLTREPTPQNATLPLSLSSSQEYFTCLQQFLEEKEGVKQ